MNVLVTGARGFVGRNLCEALRVRPGLSLAALDVQDSAEVLAAALRDADVVFHLAGVNRPQREEEFAAGNTELTVQLCRGLEAAGRRARVVLSSSTQAERDNPYGRSKRAAEDALRAYAERTGAEAVVFRLKNLFGKWCRPDYNSVTATFCHRIARDQPIEISDPAAAVDLTYVDDVVAAFLALVDAPARPGFRLADPLPSTPVTLGDLAATIRSFRSHRQDLLMPNWSSPFVRALYATYLSHLPPDQLAYGLQLRADQRGSLAEFVKAPHLGQIFVSRTHPGVTRGNHYHHTKVEKFLVVGGEGTIRLRQIHGEQVIEHRVRAEDYRVVDIPPGYTHSIENTGTEELVTLFWSSEVFDPTRPDTIADPVVRAKREEDRP
jgi:UDP-2-acetamido-2,6-beta-L-arabino-hexul-4-ose reductase